jgi:hypothetical protein
VAVRGALIVLSDDTGLRAATTALWLRGMGHQVAVLDVDAARQPEPQPAAPRRPALPRVAPADVPARLSAGAALIDISPSMAHRAAHIEGARWSIRPRLGALDLAGASEILLTARDSAVAEAAAHDLTELHGLPVSFVTGGPDDWRAAGLSVVATLDSPPDAECIDYLFFVHDRHAGNLAAAQAYLDWETGLVAQLDDQERAALCPELSLPGFSARAV